MGEYADEYLRQEIQKKYGFDIRETTWTRDKKLEVCLKCKRRFSSEKALKDHTRDKHD